MEIAFEIPSTSAAKKLNPELSELQTQVRLGLKALRHEPGRDLLSCIRHLESYLQALTQVSDDQLCNVTFKWRLPWSNSRAKSEIGSLPAEKCMVSLTVVLLYLKAATSGKVEYNQSTRFLMEAQSFARYFESQSVVLHDTKALELTVGAATAIRLISEGLLHEAILHHLLEQWSTAAKGIAGIPAASASLHARIAIYAVECYRSAGQRIPKSANFLNTGMDTVQGWLRIRVSYSFAFARVCMAIQSASVNRLGAALGHLDAIELNGRDTCVSELQQLIKELRLTFEKQNSIVSFQPIEAAEKLPLPSGRCVREADVWTPEDKAKATQYY